MQRDPVREPDAVQRRADDVGLGRKVAARVRVVGGGDAIVVAEHRLIDALGERQVGDRVVRLEQPVGLGVDRVASARLARSGRPALPNG